MAKKKLVSIALILLGIVIIVFFGMRAIHAFKKFDGHRPPRPGKTETDVELIRDWMTIPFISKTYHVPEKDFYETLGISPFSDHDKNLKDINDEFYPGQDGYVLDLVKTIILAHQPPPRPDSDSTKISPPTATVAP